jgi:hypothetical protein
VDESFISPSDLKIFFVFNQTDLILISKMMLWDSSLNIFIKD